MRALLFGVSIRPLIFGSCLLLGVPMRRIIVYWGLFWGRLLISNIGDGPGISLNEGSEVPKHTVDSAKWNLELACFLLGLFLFSFGIGS